LKCVAARFNISSVVLSSVFIFLFCHSREKEA
jgi:hypothetical protein